MKRRNTFAVLGILCTCSVLLASAWPQYDRYGSGQCPRGQFKCSSGPCIDERLICNGVVNCGADSSDENNCGGLALSNQNERPTCLVGQFQCRNGDCIADMGMCDGHPNCADRSDETAERCSDFECPRLAFKCDYGACIDGRKKCDGRNDCVDGSDEKPSLCGNPVLVYPNTCETRNFQCKNGQCVDVLGICDGQRDCSDGSDETEERCRDFECPRLAFKCNYGACIDGRKKCDGRNDCADGSDEGNAVCGYSSSINGTPVQQSSQIEETSARPPVNNQAINPECLPWSNSPNCGVSRWCEPLASKSIEGICSVQGEGTFACDHPVKPGTVAGLSCRAGYRQKSTDLASGGVVTCTSSGQWVPAPVECI